MTKPLKRLDSLKKKFIATEKQLKAMKKNLNFHFGRKNGAIIGPDFKNMQQEPISRKDIAELIDPLICNASINIKQQTIDKFKILFDEKNSTRNKLKDFIL